MSDFTPSYEDDHPDYVISVLVSLQVSHIMKARLLCSIESWCLEMHSSLSPSLQALFRDVAMMVPDCEYCFRFLYFSRRSHWRDAAYAIRHRHTCKLQLSLTSETALASYHTYHSDLAWTATQKCEISTGVQRKHLSWTRNGQLTDGKWALHICSVLDADYQSQIFLLTVQALFDLMILYIWPYHSYFYLSHSTCTLSVSCQY